MRTALSGYVLVVLIIWKHLDFQIVRTSRKTNPTYIQFFQSTVAPGKKEGEIEYKDELQSYKTQDSRFKVPGPIDRLNRVK